jgi:hypothetical protein
VGGDADSWVEVVSKVRNRLTHYDEEQESAVGGADLYFLSESLLILLMLALFVECGVSQENLNGIAENQRVLFLRRRLAEVVPRLKEALSH